MPKLSAIDSVNPAMERAKWMLLPFRFSTWLKLGFIGWLAGEIAGSGFNLNFPTSFPGREKLPPTGIPNIHFPTGMLAFIIVAGVLFIFVLSLVFLYLSSRFRFILLDAVLHGQADISRGWSAYTAAANRYFVFSLLYSIVALLIAGLVIGLPLWRAWKRGVFSGGNVLGPVLALIGSIVLILIVFALVSYVISSAFRDFVAPLLALDNLRLGDAWAEVWKFIRSEPGSFAGYLGMKVVLAIAAAIAVGIVTFICLFVVLIPALIIAVVLVVMATILKSKIAIAGIVTVGVLLFLLFAAAAFIIAFTLQAPVAVFFESYRLYFFAGRYPRLEALLWPAPPAPPRRPLRTRCHHHRRSRLCPNQGLRARTTPYIFSVASVALVTARENTKIPTVRSPYGNPCPLAGDDPTLICFSPCLGITTVGFVLFLRKFH